MRRIFGLFGVLLVLSMVVPMVVAKTETTQHSYDGWVHIQDYDGWGPALYYEEDVHVVYTADNTWTIQIKEHKDGTQDLYQVLQQKGYAEIYSIATGELLDTRRFVCHERDIDKGMDAGTWDGDWYVAWGIDFSLLEVLDYEWKICGVYHFRTYAEDGTYLIYEYTVPGVTTYSWI